MMKAVTKICFADESGEKFFGEGPYRLLRLVQTTGSIRLAAYEMNMAYSKAVRIVNNAEKAAGEMLVSRIVGGQNGGGSILTEDGKKWLSFYERYRDTCVNVNEAIFRHMFGSENGLRPLSEADTSSEERTVGSFSQLTEKENDGIGCVILASGEGKRFGGGKLLADFRGSPLIASVLNCTADIFPVRIAVTRDRHIAELCESAGVRTVLHDLPDKRDSIRLGLSEACREGLRGCAFFQADQPLLTRTTAALFSACADAAPEWIWRVSRNGQAGAPVFFPSCLFPELLSLSIGESGKKVIEAHPEMVRLIEAASDPELADADTKEDLLRLSQCAEADPIA